MLFTVNPVLKMLDKGRSFLPYRPLSRQITYISMPSFINPKSVRRNIFDIRKSYIVPKLEYKK